MIDDGHELTPAEYEELGRSVTESINRMVKAYIKTQHTCTSMQRCLSTFELITGHKTEWAQVAILLNTDPVTFLEENTTTPGRVDEQSFMKMMDNAIHLHDKMLEVFQHNGVNQIVVQHFTDYVEDMIVKMRNQLLSLNI